MPSIDHAQVSAAIDAAESKTTGQIRVLVARHKVADPVKAAQEYFNRMGLADSKHKNGVLIFLAPLSRSFAVIGDSGVHEKCGEAFWSQLADAMGSRFRKKDFTGGLVHGIEKAGEILHSSFPRTAGDGPQGRPAASEVE
jgi:uncharacterized membrane protein